MDSLPYRIRRSDRARHARIVVDADGVEVVVPRRMALRHVEPFVRQKQPWIERTLRRYQDAVVDGDVRVDVRDGGEVPYLGDQLDLDVRVEPGRTRPHVRRRGDVLTVKVAKRGREPIRDALERWYRREARAEVEHRLDDAVARAGTSYSRLTIRQISCSASVYSTRGTGAPGAHARAAAAISLRRRR